jgi:restriction endonuclease S subunit
MPLPTSPKVVSTHPFGRLLASPFGVFRLCSIVTCIGSDMGKVVLNKYKALTNQQINSIIVNEDNYFDFIYYLLKNAYRILRRNAEGSGSTMPILNKGNFENLSFTIPKSGFVLSL